jgi:hypothetical protein
VCGKGLAGWELKINLNSEWII